jgi:hypothetical protein
MENDIGLGIAMLLIVGFAIVAGVLAAARLSFRTDRTRAVAYIAPFLACCFGMCCAAVIRVFPLSEMAFEAVVVCGLLVVVFGCMIACVPDRTAPND